MGSASATGSATGSELDRKGLVVAVAQLLSIFITELGLLKIKNRQIKAEKFSRCDIPLRDHGGILYMVLDQTQAPIPKRECV
jgi:hypothetical protein